MATALRALGSVSETRARCRDTWSQSSTWAKTSFKGAVAAHVATSASSASLMADSVVA